MKETVYRRPLESITRQKPYDTLSFKRVAVGETKQQQKHEFNPKPFHT